MPASLPASAFGSLEPDETVVLRIPAASRESMSEMQRLLYDLRAELAYVLRDEQGVAGMIALGRRSSDVNYSAEDIAFLQAIGQMTMLALHSSRANQNLGRLTSELQAKVDRIAEQQQQLSVLRGTDIAAAAYDARPWGHDVRKSGCRPFDRGDVRGNSPAIQRVWKQLAKRRPARPQFSFAAKVERARNCWRALSSRTVREPTGRLSASTVRRGSIAAGKRVVWTCARSLYGCANGQGRTLSGGGRWNSVSR